MKTNHIYQGDCLEVLKEFSDEFIQCCITSPPYYGLRDYGEENQIGLEKTPEEYVEKMVRIFREVKRVLRKDGVLFLNLGDSYNGSGGPGSQYDTKDSASRKGAFKKYKNPNRNLNSLKPKDLIGIPWMVAFALRTNGWHFRQDIIWSKPNPMPESVTDRCTKSHEYLFLLSKGKNYYFDNEAIKEIATGYDGRKDTLMKGSGKYKTGVVPEKKEHTFAARGHQRWEFKNGEPMRNKRSVWTVNTKPFKKAHFAVMPEKLVEPCILAGCPEGGVVLDPFMGAGTVGFVATENNRNYVGVELNPEYIEIANQRIKNAQPKLF